MVSQKPDVSDGIIKTVWFSVLQNIQFFRNVNPQYRHYFQFSFYPETQTNTRAGYQTDSLKAVQALFESIQHSIIKILSTVKSGHSTVFNTPLPLVAAPNWKTNAFKKR